MGSTSVVVYLMDARTGRELAVRSMLNPQRQYGADVVERGNYVLKHGPEQLYRCIRRRSVICLPRRRRQQEELRRILSG